MTATPAERVSASGGNVRRRRRRSEPRWADIDAVIEVQLPHHFQERRNRLQVSLLERNVGAAPLVSRATWIRA